MNKYEKKAYYRLKRLYVHIQGPMPRQKWQSQDHFGLWDFVCFDEDRGVLIQVSTKYLSQKPKENQEKMRSFVCPKNIKKEYWRWNRKRREFIVEEL